MTEPVSLSDFKAHLRLSVSETGEDSYLTGLIVAARRKLELDVRRSFGGSEPTIVDDDAVLGAQAIMLLAAYWYDNRDGTGKMPPAIGWIVESLSQWDDGAGV